MTQPQLEDAIHMNNIKYLTLFSMNKRKLSALGRENNSPITSDQLIARVREWADKFPGQYNIQAKKSWTASASNSFNYDNVMLGSISISDSGLPMQAKPAEPVNAFVREIDIQKMETKIREEIKIEFKKAEEERRKKDILQEQIEEYTRKNEELETFAGKVSVLAQKVLQGVMGNMSAPTGNLQGTQQTNNSMNDLTQLSHSEILVANEALRILLQHTDAATLMKFAKKIESNPSVINTLLSFI